MRLYLKTKKKRVNDYLSDKDCTPLHFNLTATVTRQLVNDKIQEGSLDKKIIAVLNLSKRFKSINENGRIETPADKWRSSLDIWRHILYGNPDVTIFDVMDSLYKQQDNLLSLYCNRIKRRVFRTRFNEDFRLAYGFMHKEAEDEYQLEFIHWKEINRSLIKRRSMKAGSKATKK